MSVDKDSLKTFAMRVFQLFFRSALFTSFLSFSLSFSFVFSFAFVFALILAFVFTLVFSFPLATGGSDKLASFGALFASGGVAGANLAVLIVWVILAAPLHHHTGAIGTGSCWWVGFFPGGTIGAFTRNKW